MNLIAGLKLPFYTCITILIPFYFGQSENQGWKNILGLSEVRFYTYSTLVNELYANQSPVEEVLLIT